MLEWIKILLNPITLTSNLYIHFCQNPIGIHRLKLMLILLSDIARIVHND